jgi:hypothetical protein
MFVVLLLVISWSHSTLHFVSANRSTRQNASILILPLLCELHCFKCRVAIVTMIRQFVPKGIVTMPHRLLPIKVDCNDVEKTGSHIKAV